MSNVNITRWLRLRRWSLESNLNTVSGVSAAHRITPPPLRGRLWAACQVGANIRALRAALCSLFGGRKMYVCIHTLIINGSPTISNPRVCLSCCVHISSGSPGDPAPESRALGYGKVHALKNKPCQGSRRGGGGQAIPFCAGEASPMTISRR